ncbi:MAG: 7-cyano-7-deazaguanine synthase QueC [Pseudohongiella sp.]|nr:7-cyano-7-deazaguanine synthase QueC [Pseudohongiella sp.]
MKSIVLLSGGLDSTVSLHIAKEKMEVVLALTFDYGQKSATREITAATSISRHYEIPHKVVELPWLQEITNTALVAVDKVVPLLNQQELDSAKANSSAEAVWVPNRNGVFINIAAAFAESIDADMIITGFNAEEAVTFPDNSMPFVESIKKSLSYSTLNKVKVNSYVQGVNKAGIIKLAKEKAVPVQLCWSCYLGGEAPCGECESCLRLARAMDEN